MTTLNCPHCGKQPDDEIEAIMEDCEIGGYHTILTHCDHCGGEIEVCVSKEAWVQGRCERHSDANLDRMRAAKFAAATEGSKA